MPLAHLLKPEEKASTSAFQSCALTTCSSSNFEELLLVICPTSIKAMTCLTGPGGISQGMEIHLPGLLKTPDQYVWEEGKPAKQVGSWGLICYPICTSLKAYRKFARVNNNLG